LKKEKPEEELKKFNLRCYINSDTIKVLIDSDTLYLSFIIDAQIKCNLRVNICVSEDKNDNNAPVMFYTP
jgi:hypothetical protein